MLQYIIIYLDRCFFGDILQEILCEHLAIAKAEPQAELSVNHPFDFSQMESVAYNVKNWK